MWNEAESGDKAPGSLAFLLSQVGIYVSRRFAERMAEIELPPPLFRVLNFVDVEEGRSQQAIGEAIQVPPSRMVALVDELEQRGFVERRPDPSDRRVRAVYLTADGRKALGRGRKIAREHEELLGHGLTAAERGNLVALLQRVVEEQGIGWGVHPGLARAALGDDE